MILYAQLELRALSEICANMCLRRRICEDAMGIEQSTHLPVGSTLDAKRVREVNTRAIGDALIGNYDDVDTVPVSTAAQSLFNICTFTTRFAIRLNFLYKCNVHLGFPQV